MCIRASTGGCTWLLADTGETYAPYVNLHCVGLAGWDGDTCTIADPLQGRRRVDAAAFLPELYDGAFQAYRLSLIHI